MFLLRRKMGGEDGVCKRSKRGVVVWYRGGDGRFEEERGKVRKMSDDGQDGLEDIGLLGGLDTLTSTEERWVACEAHSFLCKPPCINRPLTINQDAVAARGIGGPYGKTLAVPILPSVLCSMII